ncbi:MAG TPA: Panacea domain-containing protein [Pyrinomonadaceae bacterium]
MEISTLRFEIPESRLKPLVSELRESIKADCGTDYSEAAIRSSVITWLGSRLDTLFEDAVERLTSPSWDDARDFARMLDDAKRTSEKVLDFAQARPELANTFNGNRAFSIDKMAAMISYMAERSSDLYKTKLNKLLFYADFVNYYLHGNSISGSRYVHLPYGPVPDGYEETLEALNHYGIIQISKHGSADAVGVGDTRTNDLLSEPERQAINWVLETYGSMSAGEISDISHQEKAYRNTRTGEEIAYEYAKFFVKLPHKSI